MSRAVVYVVENVCNSLPEQAVAWSITNSFHFLSCVTRDKLKRTKQFQRLAAKLSVHLKNKQKNEITHISDFGREKGKVHGCKMSFDVSGLMVTYVNNDHDIARYFFLCMSITFFGEWASASRTP